MKRITLMAGVLTLLISCKETKKETTETQEPIMTTQETEMPAEDQWITLFDGTSTDAWHKYGMSNDSMPSQWKIEGDALVFRPDGQGGQNIVTDEEFENFVLELEWKISDGGNSGVMWAVQETEEYDEPWKTGPEIQVLDNTKHPDAKVGEGTHTAGALYDMIAPSKDVTKPVGEWNKYILTIDHNANKGSVVLNGEEIVTFPLHGEAWDTMVANSKFKAFPGFGKVAKGKICLQDHSDVVSYRNIRIKRL